MKKVLSILFVFIGFKVSSQELFVFTEPASNMPTHSLGIRLNQQFMQQNVTNKLTYYQVPELMWGANKKLMIHADFFLSNQQGKFKSEGAGFYAKYRFFTIDQVHTHFRLATFVRGSFINSPINQEEINLYGQNSGYSIGFVGTQLLHKVALSASVAYVKATDNSSVNKFPVSQSNNGFMYTASFGKLLLPKKYNSYKQINLNFMTELLGQSLNNGKSYLDVAPAIQFIFNSQARIDIGYKKEVYSNLERTSSNSYFLRFEYLLFNVFK